MLNVQQAIEHPAPRAAGEDAELVHAAQAGDAQAFASLVSQCQKRVFRVAYSILQNWEDAEDVSQNIFVKAFQNLAGFQHKSRFATWITRIAVNESLMVVRQRRGKTVSLDEPVLTSEGEGIAIDVRDLGLNPEQACNQSELRQILAKALDELRPALRIVFVLRDMEGLSTEETAEAIGINVPAVKTRLLRARLALRQKLQRRLALSRSQRGILVASLLPV